ncbi:MAG: SDR family oxidoreductase [Parvularculaceae bacterium]|nr:SDR family oxidoreductase [Parvularculaceae bacterium]
MDVAGKTVFITGGAGGIGGGIAEAFVERGARVVLADIDHALAAAAASPFGKAALAVELDVASPQSWKSARAAAETAFGAVDILCNNAGVATPLQPLEEVTPDDFAGVFSINVAGVHNGVVAFAAGMKARRSGHIVNTSSVNGLLPHGRFGVYTASKFAILGLSDALRQELEPFGVGVSTLFPGLTRSCMSLRSDSPAAADKARAAALEAAMMEPVWLGRAVVRAVERNDAYIVTHPAYRAAVEARAAAILAAFGEPAQPGYGVASAASG